METEQTKICNRCGTEKALSEFYKHKRCRLGVAGTCKICCDITNKLWRKSHPEGVKAYQKKWQKANPEKHNATQKMYRETHLKRVRAATRKWEEAHIEEKKLYNKAYRRKNRERINSRSRINYQANDAIRLNMLISNGILKCLKSNKNGCHWESLVGYTLNDLRRHLKKLFKPGMSWDNYGQWHVDHEIPKSVFNFSKPEHIDFKRCWALSNLQPLWAKENLIKNGKLIKSFQPALAM